MALRVGKGGVAEDRLARMPDRFGDPRVAAVLVNPTIPADQREALFAASPRLFDAEGTNLTRLLVESGRIEETPAIAEEFQRLADEAAGRVRATVTTAVELQRGDREQVEKQLSERLHKEVRLAAVVDSRIVGGLKLQYGDRVIDASVAARLQQLRRLLAAT